MNDYFTFDITPSNDGRFITLHERIMGVFSQRVVDTEDRLIRQELHKMGWRLVGDEPHLNPASSLPPVACPIVIELPGQGLKRAERTGFVTHKDNQMEYILADGSKIIGRFRWTYP